MANIKATNLTAMLFEALTAPSIPTRLAKMASSSSRSRVTESQRDDVDTADKAHAVLDTLEKKIMVLGSKWGRAEVEVKEDGFYVSLLLAWCTASLLSDRTGSSLSARLQTTRNFDGCSIWRQYLDMM